MDNSLKDITRGDMLSLTAKEKARLVCMEYTDKKTLGYKTNITKGDVTAIQGSLKTQAEKEEFTHWVGIYKIYCQLTPLVGLCYKEYQVYAERVLGYLRRWEAYDLEKQHLNQIYSAFDESGDEAALKIMENELKYIHFWDANLRRDSDGFLNIDITPLKRKIKTEIAELTKCYEAAKAMVIVTEEYTRKTKSAKFRPAHITAAINSIKEDYALRVAPRYSRKRLEERIARGDKVRNDEISRAVYPSYEDIAIKQNYIDLFEEKLNFIIEAYGNK